MIKNTAFRLFLEIELEFFFFLLCKTNYTLSFTFFHPYYTDFIIILAISMLYSEMILA